MDIYMLIENTKPAGSAFLSEHGLSMYFKFAGKRILFDTGASDKFIYNATLHGIDLSKVDICVISHGHYDHTGGLAYFLEINKKAVVYMKKGALDEYYTKRLVRYIYTGINRDFFNKYSERLVFVDDDVDIAPGLTIANITKYRHYPVYTNSMFQKKDGKMVADDLSHEIFINAKTDSGNVVLTGCSHHGLINILRTAQDKFGKIYGVVGGFHLNGTRIFGIRIRKESKHEIKAIGKFLEKSGIKKIYTGHCTGEKPCEKLCVLSRTKKMQSGDVLKL
jgi:7,8-dihydropterin-6-yl-methyl-4-(beta-D-ribofuranosyl)aminobenzene 5'-phosphate synthase